MHLHVYVSFGFGLVSGGVCSFAFFILFGLSLVSASSVGYIAILDIESNCIWFSFSFGSTFC